MSMHTSLIGLCLLSVAALVTITANAKPQIVYRHGSTLETWEVVEVTAIVGIEEPENMCEQRIADVIVDKVEYEEGDDRITGFRATKPAPNESYTLFRIDSQAVYGALANADRGDIQKLIKKGARLVVIYQVCGSGGFVSVRDLFKKSAVNNP